MPSPPSYQKVDPSQQGVMDLVLSSKTLALPMLDEFAQTILAQRISMVSGVAAVRVYATMKYAVRVDVDPRKLAGYSIGIDEVASSISNANVNLPTGTIYGADKTLVLQADGQMFRAGGVRPQHHRLPQRQPGAARRGRARLRRRRNRQADVLVPGRPLHLPVGAEAAGHQRRRRRRRGQEGAAGAHRADAGRGEARHPLRSVGGDPPRRSTTCS